MAQLKTETTADSKLKVMDKPLTPSPWTTLMDYPNGLPLKILFQMNITLRSFPSITLRIPTAHNFTRH